MKFRDDIDPATTWVVSDTHFGHDNIVGFCHRPEDHEQVMLAEWRAAVPDDATVLHLGDLCYKSNSRFKNLIAKEFTGARKLLIQGNHDDQRYGFYRQCGFRIVRPFALELGADDEGVFMITDEIAEEGGVYTDWQVSFSHYPWSNQDEGGPLPNSHIRIHGHIHNNGYTRDGYVPFLRNHINMSVEQTKYRPVNLKLLLEGYLLGKYPETTPEQHAEAARRRRDNFLAKESL